MEHEQDTSGAIPAGVSVIENCPMAFECPRTWESLASTDNPGVRHCDACSQDVTFCADADTLEKMTATGACVAFYTVQNEQVHQRMGSVARPANMEPDSPERRARLRAFIDSM
jgi:hypothetical protein